MSCRFMRLLVFFDLPTLTAKDMREYRMFRKFLLKNGFIMMQESVYSKLIVNGNSGNLMKVEIKKNLPAAGLVQMLQVTEKQFADIEYLVGHSKTNIIDTMERVVKI